MRAWISRSYNAAFDWRYGISTIDAPASGQASALGDQVKYVATDYLALTYLFAPLAFGPQDVFVDIGCGLGRAVLMAARRPIRHAIGIEYDPRLADLARRNALHLRGARAPVDIRCEDAAQSDYAEGTIFWLYHPFGAATMASVLARLRRSVERAPRRIVIAYVNPVLAAQLDAQDWLRRAGERRFPAAGENGHAICWQADHAPAR